MSFEKEEHFLKTKNIKPTAMRLLVLQYFFLCNEAVSLTDIELAMPNADKSTIFRSLKTFEEKGVLHTIHEGAVTKYALCTGACKATHHQDKHPHFHCTKCNTTVCLHTITLPKVQLPENYIASTQEYLIHGVCKKCNKVA